MNDALRLVAGLSLAGIAAYAATPVAMRLAAHFDFYDHPGGMVYKDHARPVPYLGGVAVVFAFVGGVALTSGGGLSDAAPILGGTLLSMVVGTLDDRRPIPALARVAFEAALGIGLWAAGLGWDLGVGTPLDAVATAVWVVAVVNAFNLFDNMDGVAASAAAVAAAGIALLPAGGDPWLPVAGAVLCGACAGFLPYNLASPPRVFLGDGGSMALGFATAALVTVGARHAGSELQAVLMALLLVGLPGL
ncbi:MAG: UDP-GlcNAc:undecaprenyl-phosphate/decaprenyl-phosphate GlcNAc-phosphate transferase, partial [Frankiales bacterium]|nr:UDP-GlcNAc:undecaprenyl-phosphate/decaprenyl-phosphate GlcNAc-phosphate transferase [Frankiales bacterium]